MIRVTHPAESSNNFYFLKMSEFVFNEHFQINIFASTGKLPKRLLIVILNKIRND